MKQENNSGFILILTLLIISLGVIIGAYLFNRGSMYVPFSRIVIDREKAKQLALSGVHVAFAHIAFVPEKKEQMPLKNGDRETFLLQESIMHFVPSINQWQSFELTEEKDGVDGRLQLCFMSEEGKININKIYDFEKKQFIGIGQKEKDFSIILQEGFALLEKKMNVKNLFSAFEELLKKREHPFDDVTQLLEHAIFKKAFENRLFYEPKTIKNKERSIYLTDLFTIFSSDTMLNPWMLSESIITLTDLSSATMLSIDARKAVIEKIKKNITKKFDWNVDWRKFLQPLYQQERLPLWQKIIPLFTKNFKPKVFSVLSYAQVGRVTQRLYVIIERSERADNDQIVYDIKVKRFYWL